jgi:transposase
VLTPGECHDTQAFPDVLSAIPVRCTPDYGVADKAFDSDAVRDKLVNQNICPVIPSKANRIDPIAHDEEFYRERNRVERLVGKLKQFRRIATRYEKLATTFLALIHMVAAYAIIR